MIENSQLSEQVKRLEKRNTVTQAIVIGLTCVLLILVGLQMWPIPQRILKVQELELVDSSGHLIGQLANNKSGNCLRLSNRDRTTEIQLCAGEEGGAALNMYSAAKGSRVVLAAGGKEIGPGDQRPLPKTTELTTAADKQYVNSGLFIEEEMTQQMSDVNVGKEVQLSLGNIAKPSIRLSTSDKGPQILVGEKPLLVGSPK